MGLSSTESIAIATDEYIEARDLTRDLANNPELTQNPGAFSQAVDHLSKGALLLGSAVAWDEAGELQRAIGKASAARDRFEKVEFYLRRATART